MFNINKAFFHHRANNRKLTTKSRPQPYRNKLLSGRSCAFFHTHSSDSFKLFVFFFFFLHLNSLRSSFQLERFCCMQLQRDVSPALKHHCEAWEPWPTYFIFQCICTQPSEHQHKKPAHTRPQAEPELKRAFCSAKGSKQSSQTD